MVKVNPVNNTGNITVSGSANGSGTLIITNPDSSKTVTSIISGGLVVDIDKLFSGGNGINLINRVISVDTAAVAMKSDIQDFLTEEDIENKADISSTLAGYGILDGVTFEKVY